MKNIFISYSRKDAINVADFRSVEKFRNFQILIDDEEISFDKPWKQNIKNKIENSNGAILFISNNALNHDSPIRTLELPLIAKRFEDPEDDFYFFPVFLEEIDEKKLNKYSFTPEGKTEEVNFLEFFQLYDLSSRNEIINLPQRKKKNEFKILNADISNVLEGKNLSPGRDMLNTLKKRRILISSIATFSLFSGLSLFSQTDAFAVFLLRTYEAVSSDVIRPEDQSATVKFIASQLDNFENLEEIAENENLLDSVSDINKINIVLDQQQEVVNFSSSQESSSQESSSQESSSQESSSQESSSETESENSTVTTQSTTTTLNTQEDDNLAPTFSEQLNASDITSGEVTVSWNANDNVRVTKYILREGSFIIYEGTNNSKRVEGLVAGKTYTFSVDAYDDAGNVSSSNVNFTTNDSTVPTTTIPENTTTSTSTSTTSTTTTTIGPYDTAEPPLTEPYIISYNLASVSDDEGCVSFEFGGTQAVRFKFQINGADPLIGVSDSGNNIYATGYAQIGDQGSAGMADNYHSQTNCYPLDPGTNYTIQLEIRSHQDYTGSSNSIETRQISFTTTGSSTTTTSTTTTTVPPTTTTSTTTTTTSTTTTTTTTLPSQGSNAGLDYIGWFTCSLDGGGPNYIAGVDFNMVSGGVGYVQIEYSLNGGGWTSLESNYEISSGSSVTKTAVFSNGSDVQFRYRVSKYNGVHTGVNWSNTFISGQGEISNPIEVNSTNCS